MPGLVPSRKTLVGHVGPPWAVLASASSLTQPLQLFFLSGLFPGTPLDVCPGEF